MSSQVNNFIYEDENGNIVGTKQVSKDGGFTITAVVGESIGKEVEVDEKTKDDVSAVLGKDVRVKLVDNEIQVIDEPIIIKDK